MNDKVVLASLYIPKVGPRVMSVGMVTEEYPIERLVSIAKSYVAKQGFDGLVVMTLPLESLREDISQLKSELLAKSVKLFAEKYPEQMASEEDIRDYDEIPDWDTTGEEELEWDGSVSTTT